MRELRDWLAAAYAFIFGYLAPLCLVIPLVLTPTIMAAAPKGKIGLAYRDLYAGFGGILLGLTIVCTIVICAIYLVFRVYKFCQRK